MSENREWESIFDAASVAIAGVSPGNTGQFFLDVLLQYGFSGIVYPLNPKGGEISGLRVYANIKDVPAPVDYVISCIPARFTAQLIKDCAAKGAKVVCVYTAGFSEGGSDEGRALEAEILRLARAGGLRIIGPNCIGVYCPKSGLAFAHDLPKKSGPVALVCQSGGNAAYLVRSAAQRGVHFSKAISYGNGCDINESELLQYLRRDDETRIVAIYVEGVRDGPRFRSALEELAATKPVVVLKGGCTQAGAGVALSHTGALAGSDIVWNRLLLQSGAIPVNTLEELVDMLVTLLYMPCPKGRRIAIWGSGGGASVLATDVCVTAGFTLPPLPEEIKKEFRILVGGGAGTILSNPIDLPPVSAEISCSILRRLGQYEGIDLVIAQIPLHSIGYALPVSYAAFRGEVEAITGVHNEMNQPIAVVIHYLTTGESWQMGSDYQQKCSETGLPVYYSIASAVKAADRLLRFHEGRLG